MKNLLFSMLIIGAGYSQCNESNWGEYYPNMHGCDLDYANLTGENLSGANLAGASFVWGTLSGANLSGSNLSSASLFETNLSGADLSGANLSGASLFYANLTGACLEGAIGFTQTDYIGTPPILEGCASGDGDCSFEDIDDNSYDDASYSAGAASVAIDSFTCAELNYQYNNVGCVDENAITQADVDAAYAAGAASVTPEDGITQDTVDAAVAVAEMESYILGAQSGDINDSGFLNVTDIILYVELILNGE
jgi:uncharacterized protein YjbI with pentapeptide repeats